MIGINTNCASCAWPKASYDPATLPEGDHAAVRQFFLRSAMRDILPQARTVTERNGLRERCEEVASEAYLHWRTSRFPKIAAGDHAHAIYATRRYMRMSGWHGRTGQRRKAYRQRTREMIAERERFAARMPDTPATMAAAVERLISSPMLYRKAMMLAKRTGYASVDALLASVAGEGHTQRGRYAPAPIPAPCSTGERTPASVAYAPDVEAYRAALAEYYACK